MGSEAIEANRSSGGGYSVDLSSQRSSEDRRIFGGSPSQIGYTSLLGLAVS
jgi:hypothetical protein